MKLRVILLVAMAAGAALGAIERLQHVWNAKDGDAVDVPCVVTAAFPDAEDGFVAADVAQYDRGGVLVKPPAGGEIEGAFGLGAGEAVVVRGTVVHENGTPVIRANRVMRTGRIAMAEPPPPKISDFRKGWLHLRRTRIEGWVVSCNDEPREGGGVDSVLWMRVPGTRGSVAVVVRGGISGAAAEPNAIVAANGVVMNETDSEGRFIAAHIEANAADVHVVQAVPPNWWRVAAVATSATLPVLLIALFVLWLRISRERTANAAVARDRRRVAAELHDTIEQHLATAKLYLTAALDAPQVPDDVAGAVKMAENVLVHAKMEVRDAVMDLRGEGRRNAREELRAFAAQVSAGGAVKVRTSLAALPESLGTVRERDLVAIVREAVTNAVKHGHAKTIVIVCDKGGATSAALRVANDGEPFDAAAALGPEAGHYGLSGMRERAARSGFKLSFATEGKWTFVRVEVKV